MSKIVKNGERDEYATGALRGKQAGRGRYDLISPYGLHRLAVQYEVGGIQKGDRNWEQGFPTSRAISSSMRHMVQQLAGDRSEDHYAAAAWQCFCAMHFEEMIKLGLLDAALDDVPLVGVQFFEALGSFFGPLAARVGIKKPRVTSQVALQPGDKIAVDPLVYHRIFFTSEDVEAEVVLKGDDYVLQLKEQKC